MAGSGTWILVGNFEKWQRLSVNVVASATARWRPLMDCECSRKMAGVGIWGEKLEFWEATDVDYRMANSCLRDGGGWISGFGLLTIGIDVLGSAAARWRAGVYCEDGFNLFQREIWILTAKHLNFKGTSVSGYWNLIIRTQLYVEKKWLFIYFTVLNLMFNTLIAFSLHWCE